MSFVNLSGVIYVFREYIGQFTTDATLQEGILWFTLSAVQLRIKNFPKLIITKAAATRPQAHWSGELFSCYRFED